MGHNTFSARTATAPTARHSLSAAFSAKAEIPTVLRGVMVAATPAAKARPKATGEKVARTPKTQELHACRCRDFVAEDGEWTGCEAMTARTFAPGHDAKLGSLLQKKALANVAVHDATAGTYADALFWAAQFPFGAKVAGRVADAQAKRGALRDKDAAYRA